MKEKSKEENMKAPSIEEKAKAYDEALSVAQETYTTQPMYRDWLAKMFPELKENEDELKWLTRFIEEEAHCLSMDIRDDEDRIKLKNLQKSLAWLEKQGNNPTPINIDKMVMEYSQTKDSDFGLPANCMIRAYRKGIIDVWNLSSGIEKQNEQNHANSTKACKDEQNPTDKIEPKFKIKYASSEYNVLEVKDIAGVTYYGIEDEPNHIDYVQAENCERVDGYSIKESGSPFPTKPAKFSEQTSAWSEEDAEMVEGLNNCLDELEEVNGWRFTYVNDENVELCKIRNWLKLLKERVACEANCTTTKEWSEDEESIINKAESWLDTLCDYLKDSSPEYISDIKDVINKLKSIKDRYTWKPSSIQMECLHDAIEHYHTNGYPATKLTELYEQMSKIYKLWEQTN